MFLHSEGVSPSANLMEVKARETQGRHREVRSERSVYHRCEPTNRNWIRGVEVGRVRIPRQSCHRFQVNPATDSTAKLPPHPGHRAETMPGEPLGILGLSLPQREEQMPAQRLAMRQVYEVLRLKWGQGLSERKIAQSLGISRPAVAEYVRRAQAAGLSWPLPTTCDAGALERLLFPSAPARSPATHVVPDWAIVHHELKRKGVTLFLLWQEYKAAAPDGLQYSWFCHTYRAWARKLDLAMRQTHRAGEKLFVDYAGQGIPIINRHNGEVHEAVIFVAVLGASSYTYAEATWSQSLPDWIGSHVRTLAALGGVPEIVVPDNLKVAVTRAHRYEPVLNRTYTDLAQHYGFAVIPARAAKPRDKAKVEVGVQVVERWLLARLRHHTFFALAEVNAALAPLLATLNARPFKKLPGSRQELFETLDRPALRPLPAQPYEYAEWKLARVNIDYHVEVEGHYYSVPYALVRQQLDVRLSASVVELFAVVFQICTLAAMYAILASSREGGHDGTHPCALPPLSERTHH
jgi:transposase